ncbi:hypothetical protein CPB86DRAFT_830435 [Serendipita vermifera]|nr:hypothetical protein CPB86DRAFT_830435 [Serendipita vermifera]
MVSTCQSTCLPYWMPISLVLFLVYTSNIGHRALGALLSTWVEARHFPDEDWQGLGYPMVHTLGALHLGRGGDEEDYKVFYTVAYPSMAQRSTRPPSIPKAGC